METIKSNLDLDFMGGQGSLTKTEEKQLSDYFKSKKKKFKTKKLTTKWEVNSPNAVQ